MTDRFAVIVEDVGTEEKDGRVDEHGSKIFDDEDSFPCYLRAWKENLLDREALT